MNLEYTPDGAFVTETQALVEKLEADCVIMLVFGSKAKGVSGCCCEMRVSDPQKMAWTVIGNLRGLADAMENDLKMGALKDDQDGHEQEKLKHKERDIRPRQPNT